MKETSARSRLGVLTGCALLGLACSPPASEVHSPSGSTMGKARTPVAVNAAPTVTEVRFVPATPLPGEPLQAVAVVSDPDGDPVTLHYEWELDGSRIVADGERIVVPEADRQSRVTVSVTASDGSEQSLPVITEARLGNRAPRIEELQIETLDAAEDDVADAQWEVHAVVDDPDGDHTSFRVDWIVNGVVVEEDAERFSKSRVRRGDEVRVRVVAFDGESESIPLESASIVMENGSPVIVSQPPGIDRSGVFRYLPRVEDRDGDERFSFRLLEGPEGMQLDPETGELVWTPSLSQPGSHRVELEVADELGATSRQVFHVLVEIGRPVPAAAR